MEVGHLVNNVKKISAFSCEGQGGNPAGVYIADNLPSAEEMQAVAAEIGFSETVFAMPLNESLGNHWKVRYYSPESEVPFCGHATIALGAALTRQEGAGVYDLSLSEAEIKVEGHKSDGTIQVALQSPKTLSKPANAAFVGEVLDLFRLTVSSLDSRIPVSFAHAGANHLILTLKDRSDLAGMSYDLDEGRDFMRKHELITVMLVFIRDDKTFDVRNAFASGGVLEDPATGAAAAAFSGLLRDLNWNNFGSQGGAITLNQGEDMGVKSLIHTSFSEVMGSSIRVSGTTRLI